jgi:hypothetical protein
MPTTTDTALHPLAGGATSLPLLINRKTKRCVDLSYGGRDCILFTFDRVSDPEYSFVRSGVSELEARVWLDDGDWDAPELAASRRAAVRGRLGAEVEEAAGMALAAGKHEAAAFIRRAWTELQH